MQIKKSMIFFFVKFIFFYVVQIVVTLKNQLHSQMAGFINLKLMESRMDSLLEKLKASHRN